jgi:N-acetylglucosaminyldiphosphoundecaprenol N-acetyl-beta-D-mannosaminyltransferase
LTCQTETKHFREKQKSLKNQNNMKKVRIGKVLVDNVTLQESVGVIDEMIVNNEKTYVVTPNVDHIVKLESDQDFLRCYQGAGLVLADGNPLVWASRLLGTPLKERVTGSDLFPALCENAAKRKHTVFFLGGLEGVAQKAAENLQAKHPDLNVVGVYSPPFGFDKNKEENDKIVAMINEVKPNILFVGVGAPKQEKWIYNNINDLDINVAIGIGASFDFEAGTIKRASKTVQKAGLEWFWRFSNEPTRLFKRYFVDSLKFIPIIVKQATS